MKILLLLPLLFIGCAGSGSGPNGQWTAKDTEAASAALNNVADTYQRVRYAPAPVYPAPVYPAPLYPVSR